ncbi:MAG: hypothetical protein EA379_03945 [Phycisphaerales bacterium]|nr:MAG: hypothetical protein EA379_03945 [Phycisphaerales bacterium]
MTLPTLARHVSLVATITVLCAALTGCIDASSARYHDTRRVEVAHVPGSAVEVQARNGSIEISRSSGGGAGGDEVVVSAVIRARTQDRLDNTTIVIHRETSDGALRISADWPDGRVLSGESCSFVVHLPDANGVRAETTNGAIRLAGLAGEAVLTTSNGRVAVDGHDGAVSVRTSNGRVGLNDVAGATSVRTSNGRVETVNVGAPLTISTSNGRVQASLRPDAPGPIDIASSNGAVSVVVGKAFAGRLALSTSNGRVSYTDGEGTDFSGRGSLNVQVGQGETPSRVRSSNGSIAVRVGAEQAE